MLVLTKRVIHCCACRVKGVVLYSTSLKVYFKIEVYFPN